MDTLLSGQSTTIDAPSNESPSHRLQRLDFFEVLPLIGIRFSISYMAGTMRGLACWLTLLSVLVSGAHNEDEWLEISTGTSSDVTPPPSSYVSPLNLEEIVFEEPSYSICQGGRMLQLTDEPANPEAGDREPPGKFDVVKMSKGMKKEAKGKYKKAKGKFKEEKKKKGKHRCSKLKKQLKKDYKHAQKHAKKGDYKLAEEMMKKDYSNYTVIFGHGTATNATHATAKAAKPGKSKGKLLQKEFEAKSETEDTTWMNFLQGGSGWGRRRKKGSAKEKSKQLRHLRKWRRKQLRHLKKCTKKAAKKLKKLKKKISKAKFRYKWFGKVLVMLSPILAKVLGKMKFGDKGIDEIAAGTGANTTVDGIAKLPDVKEKVEFQTFKAVHPPMSQRFMQLMEQASPLPPTHTPRPELGP